MLTHRSFVSAAALALPARALAAPVPSPEPDPAAVALDRWMDAHARLAAVREAQDTGSLPAAILAVEDAAERLADAPATGPAGLRGKAVLALHAVSGGPMPGRVAGDSASYEPLPSSPLVGRALLGLVDDAAAQAGQVGGAAKA